MYAKSVRQLINRVIRIDQLFINIILFIFLVKIELGKKIYQHLVALES